MYEMVPIDGAAQFLADHYGPRATHPEPLGAGEWSQAYAFALDGQELVIRFGNHGDEDFAKDDTDESIRGLLEL